MTYLQEFDIQDFDFMDLKPNGWVRREDRALFEAYADAGPAVTLWTDDGIVIACAGITCACWKGFGEAWMLPSIHVPKYPKAVYVSARDFINDVIDKLGLYRVQATIRECDHVAVRWIEHLGFQREGLMRNFGRDKENHYMYARIK